jgi:hypothetical protein
MKRPSYLQQVTPVAPGRHRANVLSPPRLLFRPSAAAPDLIEIETPSPRSTAAPARPTRVAPAVRDIAAPDQMESRRVARRAPRGVPQPPEALPRAARARSPARAPEPTPPVEKRASSGPAHAAPRPAAERGPAPSRSLPTPFVGTGRQEIAPPRLASEVATARAENRHTRATAWSDNRPAAIPGGASSAPPPASRSDRQPAESTAPEIARPARAVPERVTRAAILPAITPAPLPPPAARPSSERAAAAPTLHIGTLEVRVAAPAPAVAPSGTAPRRAAPAPRASASGATRIARAFGVFGWGQT